jgi:hypothetical protein
MLLSITCLLSFLLHAETEPNYVTCRFMGQLGNQLFEASATLAYAWDYGATPVFPGLHSNFERLDFNKDHMFFRLNSDNSIKPFEYQFIESSWDSPERIPRCKNLVLVGYFQSYKHFHHHRDKILQIFAPSQTDLNYLQNKYKSLLEHPNTVAIHVRTLHKEQHDSKDFPFIGLQYYKNAVNEFPKDALFVVFSDRINWCKRHFPQFCTNVEFIEGNDHVQDLHLMSMMKHVIMGNSTYSWWGAYFNTNPNKVIIAPEHWHHPDRYNLTHPNNLYLPEWKVVKSVMAEYPADMTHYDIASLSLGQ